MEQNTPTPARTFWAQFGRSVLITLVGSTVLICLFLAGYHLGQMYTEAEAAQAAEAAAWAEHNQTVTSFPHRMKINEKTAYLSGVDLFETKIEHGYVAHLIITIDRGELSDDDMYWILKGLRYEWELDASAHWWPDGTDGDIESLHFLGCRYTDSHIYFFFYTDKQRESIQDKHFYVSVTYLRDGADYSEEYRYSHSLDFSDERYHGSADFLPVDTLQNLLDALEDANS